MLRKIAKSMSKAVGETAKKANMAGPAGDAPAAPSAPSGRGRFFRKIVKKVGPAVASAANSATTNAQTPSTGGGLKRFKKLFSNAAQPMVDAGERMGKGLSGLRRKFKKIRDAQPAAAPAGMKKGGAVAKKGSAMKSMMADKKGRAMKKTGSDAMGRAMAKKPAAKKMMGGGMMGYKFGGMAKKKSGRSC
jgi:S1-C subfamily serine protease